MNEKDRKSTKTKRLLDFVYDAGDSPQEVREYLEEHVLNYEQIVREGLDFITKLQLEARRKLAVKKGEAMRVQYAEFIANIATKTREEVLGFIHGSKVQLSFRNYKYEEMSDEELRKIATEIIFLQEPQKRDDEKT